MAGVFKILEKKFILGLSNPTTSFFILRSDMVYKRITNMTCFTGLTERVNTRSAFFIFHP